MAAGKCARPKAAPHLLKHVVSAPSMALMEHANLMAAPTVQVMDHNIVSHTAERRTSRAPWRAAPPPLFARVFVSNTAAVRPSALFQAAPAKVSARLRPAKHMAVKVTARTHQDATRLRPSLVQTARSIPINRKLAQLYMPFDKIKCHYTQ